MIILEQELMSRHTTFRTGGPADYFIKIEKKEDIPAAIAFCQEKDIPYQLVGNGSNLLVSDTGVRGAIIQIYDGFQKIQVDGNKIYAEAGALLSQVAAEAKKHSLTGFEFASGIPGTIGGGVFMNAGAYNGEMKQVVTYVDVWYEGKLQQISAEDMKFKYRYSVACDLPMIILGAEIMLQEGDSEEISSRMQELAKARKDKQPLEYPSAGSTFKRPEGHFAGKLIMDAGLAGYRVGGAMVSEKHCGFVINYDHADSDDIYRLIYDVQRIVSEQFGVVLEPEVRMIGNFSV